jgi:hypothetical protein
MEVNVYFYVEYVTKLLENELLCRCLPRLLGDDGLVLSTSRDDTHWILKNL